MSGSFSVTPYDLHAGARNPCRSTAPIGQHGKMEMKTSIDEMFTFLETINFVILTPDRTNGAFFINTSLCDYIHLNRLLHGT